MDLNDNIKEIDKKTEYLDLFFSLVTKYLEKNGWKYSKTDVIDGREEVWRKENKSIIHWENFKTHGARSFHSPKHVWRTSLLDGSLSFSYGLAPY